MWTVLKHGVRTARRRRHRLRRRGQGRRRRGQGAAPARHGLPVRRLCPAASRVVSHAKFIVIDHEVLLLTSANFSFSAENRNVEFGLLVRDARSPSPSSPTMTSKHGTLYELV